MQLEKVPNFRKMFEKKVIEVLRDDHDPPMCEENLERRIVHSRGHVNDNRATKTTVKYKLN